MKKGKPGLDASVGAPSDSTRVAEPHTDHARHVIDVKLRRSAFREMAFMLGAFVLVILSAGVTAAVDELGWINHRVAPVVCGGMFVLCASLLFSVLRRYVYGRVKSLCHMYANRSTEELVSIIVGGFRGPGMSILATALVEVLSQRGEPGFVIRCCPRDEGDPIEPVAFPFEPLVLDEVVQRHGGVSSCPERA